MMKNDLRRLISRILADLRTGYWNWTGAIRRILKRRKDRVAVTFTRQRPGREDATTKRLFAGSGRLPGGGRFQLEFCGDGRVLARIEGSILKPHVVWDPGKGGRVFCGFRTDHGFGTFNLEDQ